MIYPLETNMPMTLSHVQGHSLLQAFTCDFLPAWRYACTVLVVIACPSVRLSVCHKPELYQNG